jgi:hypothetical protein
MTAFTSLKRVLVLAPVALVLWCAATPCLAYGVLAHEALIDSTWNDSILPVLEKRFPHATKEELQACRAYAHGGCVVQDMGYYPLGSKLFTDLVHYVRSGDFVEALIEEARDPKELAFALGALAHHCADRNGHPIAINRVVPMTYPKLRKKYGDEVTYEQKPSAHLKVEFGFDVLHVAKGDFLPKDYHDMIGFEVAKEILERAFVRTYGIELEEIVPDLDVAIGTYRRAASRVIPKMTEAAWEAKKDEILKTAPETRREDYVFALAKADYEKEWGKGYREPGAFAKMMSFFVRILPKVGPFKALAFHVPTPEEEAKFEESFEASTKQYRASLGALRSGKKLALDEENLDTGDHTRPGEYGLADAAYASLLVKLAKTDFAGVSPEMLAELRSYLADPRRLEAKRGGRGPSSRKVEKALAKLESADASLSASK